LHHFCPDSLIGDNGIKSDADRLRDGISRIREYQKESWSRLAQDCKPLPFLDLRHFRNRICDSVFASPYQH
jgi:hypothetical protein